MPLYEFDCEYCGEKFEKFVWRWMTGAECPRCKRAASKIPSASTFKVNGFNAKNGYSSKEGG